VVSADLRTDLLLSVDVVEIDVDVVKAVVEDVEVDDVEVEEVDVVLVSRIEESVFVQSDSVMEHPGDSGVAEVSSWVYEVVLFNLDPHSLHTFFPSTKAT